MAFSSINQARDYAFINAKLRARRTHMFRVANYEKLLHSDLNAILRIIKECPLYIQLEIDNLSDYTSKSSRLENIFLNMVYSELKTYSQWIPDKSKDFVNFYFQKHYLRSLKTLIGFLHSITYIPRTAIDTIITPDLYKNKIDKLTTAKNIRTLIDLLPPHSWEKKALERAHPNYHSTGRVLVLEQSLINAYYEHLFTQTNYLPIPDKEVARKFIGKEIDLYNIKVLLRTTTYSPEERLLQLIPLHYQLENLNKLLAATNPSEVMILLEGTPYEHLARLVQTHLRSNSFDQIDNVFEESMIQEAFYNAYTFNIGIFLSYFTLRFQEVKNLVVIINGKIRNIGNDFIRKQLIYF